VPDASRRELLQQLQRSTAAYPASAAWAPNSWRLARLISELRCSVTVFDDAPRRDAIVLVSSAHDASCRVSSAAFRFLREVARATRSTLSRRRLCRPASSPPHFHVLSESCRTVLRVRNTQFFGLRQKLPRNRSFYVIIRWFMTRGFTSTTCAFRLRHLSQGSDTDCHTSQNSIETTRSTDPLYEKISVVGLWSAITLIRRCRPIGGLDGSFELRNSPLRGKVNYTVGLVEGYSGYRDFAQCTGLQFRKPKNPPVWPIPLFMCFRLTVCKWPRNTPHPSLAAFWVGPRG